MKRLAGSVVVFFLLFSFFASGCSNVPSLPVAEDEETVEAGEEYELFEEDVKSPGIILKGVVKDSSTRKPIPDVKITLEGTEGTFTTFTDPKGYYQFPDSEVPAGIYTLQAEKKGYKTFVKDNLNLKAGKTTVLNFTMIFPEWTVLVYIAADNNLDFYVDQDILEMQRIGSSDRLHIVVFLDKKGSGDGYYYIRQGSSEPLQVLGEVNSGDGNVLSDFIQFVKENYPARRYFLILWNHGSGWRGPTRGICWDDSSEEDNLTVPELASALERGGLHFDLIGMDACIMQTVEVAYEIRNFGDILIASQAYIPGYGWDYAGFLRRLRSSPRMSNRALVQAVVQSYFSFYGSQNIALSAVDLSKVGSLATALDAFAGIFVRNAPVGSSSWMLQLRSITPDNPCTDYYCDYVDIYRFFESLLKEIPWPSAQKTILKEVQKALNRAVLYNRTGGYYRGAKGLSVYIGIPEDGYSFLAFAEDTEWDEFLQWLWSD